MIIQSRQKKISFLIVAAVLSVTYFSTLPLTLPDGDAGEFLVLSRTRGIAHPPGYPLLVSIYQLLDWLFAAHVDVIPLLAGFSSLCAIAAAVISCNLLIQIFKKSLVAVISTLAIFLSFPVWRNATAIEPFALNLLLGAVVMQLLTNLCILDSSARRNWFFVAFVFGLGLCNHHSLVFLLPGSFVVFFCQFLKDGRKRWERLSYVALGFCLGLIPLVSFFFPPGDSSFVWGEWRNDKLAQLLRHIFRLDYGSFSISAGRDRYGLGCLQYFFMNLPSYIGELFCLMLLLGMVACVLQLTKYRKAFPRLLLAALFLNSFMAVILFNILIGEEPLSADQVIVVRFYGLSLLSLLPLLALGQKYLFELPSLGRYIPWLGVAALAVQTALIYSASDRRQEVYVENYLRDVLQVAESRAVILVNTDLEWQGLSYLQVVRGLRQDISVVHPVMWAAPWYRDPILDRLDVTGTGPSLDLFVGKILFNQPVYAAEENIPEIKPRLARSYPIGPLIRIVPANQPILAITEQIKLNNELFATVLHPPKTRDYYKTTLWEMLILGHYSRPWMHLATKVSSKEQAAEFFRRAQSMLPSKEERSMRTGVF